MPKKKSQKQPKGLSPENYIRQRSRNLPIHECWISPNWKEEQLSSIIISRKHTSGNITFCMYLADIACLGIKNTAYKFNESEYGYNSFLHDYREKLPLEKTSYDLVHNIIHAVLEFAEEYGFEPHKDFKQVTQYFLEEDTEDIPIIEIDCGGDDGLPLYVNTGFESKTRVNQILGQLEKTAGIGNFHFIIGDRDLGFDDMEYEDYEDDTSDFDYIDPDDIDVDYDEDDDDEDSDIIDIDYDEEEDEEEEDIDYDEDE